MSLMLLSERADSQKETLTNVALAAVRANLRFVINQNSITQLNAIEVYIDRDYGRVPIEELECFSMDIHSKEYVKQQFENGLISFEIGFSNYCCIAGTDQAEHDHLIYDFVLEYLRLRPDHCISLYGETFYFLEDMHRLESEGGYYKGWCYEKAK